MPAIREASTQVRYYQPQGFEMPEWLKWGLIVGGVWVGYDLYKYHALPGPLETLYQRLRGESGTPQATPPGSNAPGTVLGLSPAAEQALRLFPEIPPSIRPGKAPRYYYAGPYPKMRGYVGIAEYDAAGTLVKVFPTKYTSKLSSQIGAINTGVYRAPGHYTINPAKVG